MNQQRHATKAAIWYWLWTSMARVCSYVKFSFADKNPFQYNVYFGF
jgi:hypothetical protein